MFANLHLWPSELAAPRVRPQPDAVDCWHITLDTTNCHGHLVLTGTRDELRGFVARLAAGVEAIPEPMGAAA